MTGPTFLGRVFLGVTGVLMMLFAAYGSSAKDVFGVNVANALALGVVVMFAISMGMMRRIAAARKAERAASGLSDDASKKLNVLLLAVGGALVACGLFILFAGEDLAVHQWSLSARLIENAEVALFVVGFGLIGFALNRSGMIL